MQQNSSTTQPATVTRFALGQTYITPGAEEALMIAGQTAIEFLRRHMSRDFGELADEDIQENELSLREGLRVLSAYRTSRGQRLWIITEADRTSTTILLPSEY
jgi:histidine ammonia-lyase